MIDSNHTYRHYRNGKDYVAISLCKMQQNNEWLQAVIYRPAYDDGMVYVRELKDFLEKFTKVS